MFENSADDNNKNNVKDNGENENSNSEEKSFKVVDKRLFSKDGMTGGGSKQKTESAESVKSDESAKESKKSAESVANGGAHHTEKKTASSEIKTELHDNTQNFSHTSTFEENEIIGGKEKGSVNAGGNTDAAQNDNNIEELKADFSTFVYSLNAQALFYLGKLPNPMTGKYEKDLKTARYLIDTIDMLFNKTKGNLDENESKLMTNILYDLKMFYVNEK
jgi:hypothetical protein